MDRLPKILSFIETVRSSFGGSIAVYTTGNCYQFYEILKEVFPDAEAFYDGNHVWTRIGHKYFDIRGEFNTDLFRHISTYEEFEKNLMPLEGDTNRIESLSKNKWDDQRRENLRIEATKKPTPPPTKFLREGEDPDELWIPVHKNCEACNHKLTKRSKTGLWEKGDIEVVVDESKVIQTEPRMISEDFKDVEIDARGWKDSRDHEYEDGDIIDIHQTVNGCRHFYIKSINPLEVYYYQGFVIGRKYEYDMKGLLIGEGEFSHLNETEIIDHIT